MRPVQEDESEDAERSYEGEPHVETEHHVLPLPVAEHEKRDRRPEQQERVEAPKRAPDAPQDRAGREQKPEYRDDRVRHAIQAERPGQREQDQTRKDDPMLVVL